MSDNESLNGYVSSSSSSSTSTYVTSDDDVVSDSDAAYTGIVSRLFDPTYLPARQAASFSGITHLAYDRNAHRETMLEPTFCDIREMRRVYKTLAYTRFTWNALSCFRAYTARVLDSRIQRWFSNTRTDADYIPEDVLSEERKRKRHAHPYYTADTCAARSMSVNSIVRNYSVNISNRYDIGHAVLSLNARSTHGVRMINCPCRKAQLLRSFEYNHLGEFSNRRSCDCKAVCNKLSRLVCSSSIQQYKTLQVSLEATSVMYCYRHSKWVHLKDFDRYHSLVSVYGEQCTEILEGFCFHDALYDILRGRYNKDDHAALCNYMFYMRFRRDIPNNVRLRLSWDYNTNPIREMLIVDYGTND